MALFETAQPPQQKKREKLIDISKRVIGADNKELLKELELYLKSRRQLHCYPSKVSWEMQMNLLKEYPDDAMIESVHNATLRGYRQVVFADKKQPSRGRVGQHDIVSEGF